EGRPRQQQALLANADEAHDALDFVTLANDLEHHAFAPFAVHHIVPYPQPEVLSPRRAGRRAASTPQGRFDDAGAAPLGQPGLTTALDHAREVLGDLVQEAARRVVLGGPEQRAAPRVGQVQPLAGAGDADVTQPPFLLELVGLAE